MKPETLRLFELATHDLDLAEVALERAMPEQCVFHCQQTLEKALKALQVERSDSGRPRRTHDLVALAQELALPLSEEEMRLLRRLGEQYATTRYSDEVDYDETETRERFDRTRNLFAWLRQQPT